MIYWRFRWMIFKLLAFNLVQKNRWSRNPEISRSSKFNWNILKILTFLLSLGEYVRAFRQAPNDPLVMLCLGLQYIHLACQRFARNRHSCVVQVFLSRYNTNKIKYGNCSSKLFLTVWLPIFRQGIIFLFQYLGVRGECQEAFYNIGRAFHQLGQCALFKNAQK